MEDDKTRLAKLRVLIGSLPEAHILVLRFLVDFLTKVEQHSKKTRMDAHNLATVFAPIIAHRKVCHMHFNVRFFGNNRIN